MSLDSVVNVSISTQTTGVAQASFDTPLICAYFSTDIFPERVREYDVSSGLSGLTDDGFTTSDPVYLIAQALTAQNPKITTIKVGRRANASTQTIDCTPAAKDSTTYTVTINDVPFTFESDASATVQEIVEGLAAAINPSAWDTSTSYDVGDHVTNDDSKVYVCTTAGTSDSSGGPTGTGSGISDNTCVWDYVGAEQPVTASEDDSKLTLSADVAGAMFTLELSDDYDGQDLWTRDDSTSMPDPGLSEDLDNIVLEDNDWYVLMVDGQSGAEIIEAATWTESNNKLFVATTGDSDVIGSGSSDVASSVSGSNRARTVLVYNKHPHDRAAEAWAGVMLPKDPGSATWRYKTPSGPVAGNYTATQKGYLEVKNCNYFHTLGGVDIMSTGVSAAGEFIDITRGCDWFKARLQERIYSKLVNTDKIPYTDDGVAIIEAELRAQLEEGIRRDLLAESPEPQVVVPQVSEVSSANKIARSLPDVSFEATLAGAIHTTTISGVISA